MIDVLYIKMCNKKCMGLWDEIIWFFMFVIVYNVFSIINVVEYLVFDIVCFDVLINFNSYDILF